MQQLRLFFAMAIGKNKRNCCILLELFHYWVSRNMVTHAVIPGTLFLLWRVHGTWLDGAHQTSRSYHWHLSVFPTLAPRLVSRRQRNRCQGFVAGRWRLTLRRRLLQISCQWSRARVCVFVWEEVGRNENDWPRDPTVGSGGGVPKPSHNSGWYHFGAGVIVQNYDALAQN